MVPGVVLWLVSLPILLKVGTPGRHGHLGGSLLLALDLLLPGAGHGHGRGLVAVGSLPGGDGRSTRGDWPPYPRSCRVAVLGVKGAGIVRLGVLVLLFFPSAVFFFFVFIPG